jgi:uncharacterized protein DUF6152
MKILAIATLIVAAAGPATAHHSFAAFDTNNQKSITGTVKRVEWTNPHIWIWVDVPNSQGQVDTFGFEGMSPNYLERRNWTRTSLKPGDTITIDYRPMKDGKNGGMFMNGKLASGKVLTMQGGAPDK